MEKQDEGYWDDENHLEQDLGVLMVKMKQRLWRDIEGVFQQLTFDMAYFKVHLTLKLVVEGGRRAPDTIVVEHETEEPLEGG